MADKTICARSANTDYDCRNVSAVAGHVENWGLVSKHGFPRAHWLVLRNGHLPPDTILRDYLCGTPGAMAVSEPVRGRGLLR